MRVPCPTLCRSSGPHVHPTPRGHGRVGHRLGEARYGDVAAAAQRSARQLASHLLEVGLGAGDEGDARSALREGVGEEATETTAGAGDHHALAVDVAPLGKGARDRDLFPAGRAPRALRLYRQVQYLRVPADPERLLKHRRMLVIRETISTTAWKNDVQYM